MSPTGSASKVRNVASVLVAGTALAGAFAFGSYRRTIAEAERAWADIAARSDPGERFDPEMISGLPDVARRYFTHAIAPGTRLTRTVELEMRGTFLLGDRAGYRTFDMSARQILRAPVEFVWMPSMRAGVMWISGSDGLLARSGWSRFWLNRLFPVVNLGPSPDLNRAAAARPAMEAIWAPAGLLPIHGVRWEEIEPSRARVTVPSGIGPVAIDLTLAGTGRVVALSTMRWTDANPEKTFALQPFGGTVHGEATFEGFTIPTSVRIGNHFGSEDYHPFFQAEITRARYR